MTTNWATWEFEVAILQIRMTWITSSRMQVLSVALNMHGGAYLANLVPQTQLARCKVAVDTVTGKEGSKAARKFRVNI